MVANQTGYGANGKQNFLFPLDEMYITQGSYTATYSHDGCYAMDFVGYGSGGQIAHYPYYAPFDCHIVAIWGSTSPMIVWQSDDVVNLIDGTVDYACIGFIHDDNTPSFHVGDTRRQGEIIGHTGTYGQATGDHVHIEAKKGQYQGYHRNSEGVWMLTNSTWLYNLIGVNDTTIYKRYYDNHDGDRVYYTFLQFTINNPQPIPLITTKKRFPWFIYSRRRNNYENTIY